MTDIAKPKVSKRETREAYARLRDWLDADGADWGQREKDVSAVMEAMARELAPKRAKNGRGQRQKGNGFELELVHFMREAHIPARRVPLSGGTDYAKGDVEILPTCYGPGVDPDKISPAAWNEALRVECKRRGKLPALFAHLGDFDALAFREDRGEMLVVIRASLLRDLLQ